MSPAEQKRIQEIQIYREVFLSENFASQYVMQDFLFNVLGYGCVIETEEQRIKTNIAIELLAKLSILTSDQFENFYKVMKLPLQKKNIRERFVEMIRKIPLPRPTLE